MFNLQELPIFSLKLDTYKFFHPLEVEDRGSETQLQVGEKLKNLCSAITHFL